ncbi:MAG: PAS domain S-box protein [Chitinophagaceae bacterium]|nr:PAS domain S-box protein [Chitinophagaceae bacterium]
MNDTLKMHILDVLQYSREVIWCVDMNTFDLLYTNKACFDVWGYTPEEMMADKSIFASHLHPEDAEIYQKGVAEAKQNGKSHNEFRIIHKDGSVKVIKGDAIFYKGENGLPDTLTGIAVDVTRERELIEDLAISQNRFRSISDNTPVMTWTSSVDTGVNYVNKAWVDFTGKKLEELHGADWMSILHPDDHDIINRQRSVIYHEGKPFEIECRMQRKDGVYRYMMLKGSPQYDSSNNCIGFVGTAVDLTDIKLLNEQLMDSELRFKSIANDSPILMWTADEHKHCTFFNTTWETFSGMKQEELMGDGWTKLIHPDDIAGFARERDTHFESRTPFGLECRLMGKDGVYRWMQVTGSPQFNSKGEFSGFVGNGTDITDLKNFSDQVQKANIRMQEALLESKRLMRVINRTNNIIVLADAEGRITWVNDAYTKTTGYTIQEAIGKKPGELVHGPETDPGTVALMTDAIVKGEMIKAEILNYSKNGDKYWLDVRIEPIYNGDTLTGFMAIEMDITQRKQDEKALAETNKKIRQFSFITSHELRHEFSKIMLLLNAGKLQDNTTEDILSYFAELEDPVNKINRIIQHMNETLLSAETHGTNFNNRNIDQVDEICLVDDDRLINMINKRLISKILPDVQIKVFEAPDSAIEYMRIQPALNRLTFLDLNFPDNKTGWDFLDAYTQLDLQQPVIILSSSIDNDDMERSKKYNQVADYYSKPLSIDVINNIFGR